MNYGDCIFIASLTRRVVYGRVIPALKGWAKFTPTLRVAITGDYSVAPSVRVEKKLAHLAGHIAGDGSLARPASASSYRQLPVSRTAICSLVSGVWPSVTSTVPSGCFRTVFCVAGGKFRKRTSWREQRHFREIERVISSISLRLRRTGRSRRGGS